MPEYPKYTGSPIQAPRMPHIEAPRMPDYSPKAYNQDGYDHQIPTSQLNLNTGYPNTIDNYNME
jgi:hypothetical protein